MVADTTRNNPDPIVNLEKEYLLFYIAFKEK